MLVGECNKDVSRRAETDWEVDELDAARRDRCRPKKISCGAARNLVQTGNQIALLAPDGDVVSGTAAELYRTATRDGADVAGSKDELATLHLVTMATLPTQPLMRPMGQSSLPHHASDTVWSTRENVLAVKLSLRSDSV